MPSDIPFGFGPPGGEAPDPSDPRQMQQFINQLQQLFATPGSGPVNWELARQLAQAHLTGVPGGQAGVTFSTLPMGFTLPGVGQPMAPSADADADAPKPVGDPPVAAAERASVVEALRLADLWLDPESALPSGIRSTAAWSRSEWLNATLDVWRKLCDPVAERMVSAMTELVPEEMRAQMGPMTSMVASLGGALLGGQLGTALGSLAAEVLSAGDIGLPLGPAGTAALVPANIAEYGKGLELPEDQVRLYVALREAAHQRLFGHVPWLRGHVLAAVEAYAAGGPAEQTFSALVGLDLRPRRLREATALWGALAEHRGTAGRDALWGHPDLLPDEEAFADPQTFAKSQLDLDDLDFGSASPPAEPE